MYSSCSLPFNDDVLDHLFHRLPSFSDLQATILASKTCYAVFQRHSSSIVSAVAHTLVGPSLPQALLLARNGDVSNMPNQVPDCLITQEEARALTRNHSVARALEDFFSYRHKDRSSNISKLSTTESHRFHATMYLISLFTQKFRAYPSTFHSDNDLGPSPLERIERKNFVSSFPSTELLEFRSGAYFLLGLAKWAARSDPEVEVGNTVLSAGLSSILRAAQRRDETFVAPYLRTYGDTYLLGSLDEILKERGIKVLDGDFSRNYLLSDIVGFDVKCAQCGRSVGLNLWTLSNMNDQRCLSGQFSEFLLCGFLRGCLYQNTGDKMYLYSEVHSPFFSFSAMVEEINELAHYPMSPSNGLCHNCLERLIISNLHLWLLGRKIKG
ncbi:hypothetical protein B0H10DRAFT_2029162, partial [Mycena sp. CBHHK59/15]